MDLKQIFEVKYSGHPRRNELMEFVNLLDIHYSGIHKNIIERMKELMSFYRFENKGRLIDSQYSELAQLVLSKESSSFDLHVLLDWGGGIGTLDDRPEPQLLQDPEIYLEDDDSDLYIQQFEIHLNYQITWIYNIWQECRSLDDNIIVVFMDSSTLYFNDLCWSDLSIYQNVYDLKNSAEVLKKMSLCTIFNRIQRTYPYNKYLNCKNKYVKDNQIIEFIYYRNLFSRREYIDGQTKTQSAIESYKSAKEVIKHINDNEVELLDRGFESTVLPRNVREQITKHAFNYNIYCNNPDIYEVEPIDQFIGQFKELETKIGSQIPARYKGLLAIITNHSSRKYFGKLIVDTKRFDFRYLNLLDILKMNQPLIFDQYFKIGISLSEEKVLCFDLLDEQNLLMITTKSDKFDILNAINLENLLEEYEINHN